MHFIMSGFDLTVKFYILFEKVLVESMIVDIDTLINNNAGITNTPKNWNNIFWLFEYLCFTGLVNSSSKVLIFYPSYSLTHSILDMLMCISPFSVDISWLDSFLLPTCWILTLYTWANISKHVLPIFPKVLTRRTCFNNQ